MHDFGPIVDKSVGAVGVGGFAHSAQHVFEDFFLLAVPVWDNPYSRLSPFGGAVGDAGGEK